MSERDKWEVDRLVYVGDMQFKTEDQYLTAEGYPLGTTCWFVIVEAFGRRTFVCADTPQEVWPKVAEHLQKQCERFITKQMEAERGV